MSFDIFISYSTKDAIAAKAACAALESAKIRCWMAPRDILPSASWGASIVRAINECRVMVLIFSGNANASAQVHREVDQAFGRAKTVVPLRIEDVKPADELAYYLDTVHWLDALTPPLERNLGRLVATVQALLPTTEPPPPSSEPAIDETQAAKAQDEARAEDERRLKEAAAAESAETARREQEAAEAARRQQEAKAQRLAAERQQKAEEEKRLTEEADRRKRDGAEAKGLAEQERRVRETEIKERAEAEQARAEGILKADARPSKQAPTWASKLQSIPVLVDGRARFAVGAMILMNSAWWFAGIAPRYHEYGTVSAAVEELIGSAFFVGPLCVIGLLTMYGLRQMKWIAIPVLCIGTILGFVEGYGLASYYHFAWSDNIVLGAIIYCAASLVAGFAGIAVCLKAWRPLRRPLLSRSTGVGGLAILFVLLVFPYWLQSLLVAQHRGALFQFSGQRELLVIFGSIYVVCILICLVCSSRWARSEVLGPASR